MVPSTPPEIVTISRRGAFSLVELLAVVAILGLVITFLTPAFDDLTATDLAASPPMLMGAHWRQQLLQPGFAASEEIPKGAASQVRIYERDFPLDHP